ncbi:MAG: protein translocase subunit SecD [Ignavibacteriales bacterium]|nr:MAG: protein translocase subunit SecD [Ignavibacteriales bacterium]
MKKYTFRIVIIVSALVLSIYKLYPTYQDYMNTKDIEKVLSQKSDSIKAANPGISNDQLTKLLSETEDSIKLADPEIREARMNRIKLGLDLQGGMRVVLEVNTAKLLEKLASNVDEDFTSILNAAAAEAAISEESVVDIVYRKFQEKNIRISKYYGSIRSEDSEILDDLRTQTEDAVTRAMQIIRNRVDQYGVSEPSIQRQGDRRVIVELPGVAKEEEARQLLQGTALLEFKLLKDPDYAITIIQKIDEASSGKVFSDTTLAGDTTAVSTDTTANTASNDTTDPENMTAEQFAKEHPFFALVQYDPQFRSTEGYVNKDNRAKVEQLLASDEIKNVIPETVEFLFSAKTIKDAESGQEFYQLYLVNKAPELTGGVITNALATLDPTNSNPIVNMEMSSEGAIEWSRITGANVGKRCAIILDGAVFTAPTIQGKIPGGRSQISGMENLDEAKLLEIVLKAGALPAPVDIIEERTVGPSLGQDSVSKGFNSALFGYLVVGLFMIFYYRQAGSIAAFSLIFTVTLIFGVLSAFMATLTLPGIAGIILTMGMAVDSNVLIYERIREELAVGRTLRAAVDGGFGKAYSAIIDSNITTMITGIVLYQFGTGPIQGFALTLMIGILTSLFGALVVTKVVLDYLVDKGYKVSLG